MPQNVESLILDLKEIPGDESKHISLECPWTINSENKRLTVIITCLKGPLTMTTVYE